MHTHMIHAHISMVFSPQESIIAKNLQLWSQRPACGCKVVNCTRDLANFLLIDKRFLIELGRKRSICNVHGVTDPGLVP